ncbi:MAG TPA: thermonuclease family protein [Chloroflexota bacterium]|nr:thermonuclease family protein [Chloroflexota bacterium]
MALGTQATATIVKVVDGDTLKITAPGLSGSENVRLLALDTEESNPGGTKPVTPFGKETKRRAEAFFAPGDQVTIEFAGQEPLAECWDRYRDNFGRPLLFVHKDGVDFQETMIREGFSPYFVKYGNVPFAEYHRAYMQAERVAQAAQAGLWDQIRVNGAEMRNYAALGVWWHTRALVIDEYRRIEAQHADLFNSRLDYAVLLERSAQALETTVFTELRSTRQVGGEHVVIDIGSLQQPFQVFVRDADTEPGRTVVQFVLERYISEEPDHPRRSYAYVRGKLTRFQNRPDLPPIVQVEVTSPDQITDAPPA